MIDRISIDRDAPELYAQKVGAIGTSTLPLPLSNAPEFNKTQNLISASATPRLQKLKPGFNESMIVNLHSFFYKLPELQLEIL